MKGLLGGLATAPALPAARAAGFVRMPLIRGMELSDVVIDVLHLLLRIGGRLLTKLIEVHITTPTLQTQLEEEFDKIGIAFHFWKNKETAVLEWTSLSGINLNWGLTRLNLSKLIPGDDGLKVTQLWSEFMSIYLRVNSDAMPDMAQLRRDILSWGELYLQRYKLLLDDSLRVEAVEEGMYSTADVTPYIHILMCHIPQQIEQHGPLRQYSCQTLEHVNHVNQLVFFRMTPRGGGRNKNKLFTEHIMNYHLRTQKANSEKEEERAACRVCGKYFTYLKRLRTHEEKIHNIR